MKFLWTSPLVRNMETSTSPHYQKQLQMNCNADSWASNSKRSLDVSCKCLLKKKLSLIILNIVWVVWQDRGSLNDKCTRRLLSHFVLVQNTQKVINTPSELLVRMSRFAHEQWLFGAKFVNFWGVPDGNAGISLFLCYIKMIGTVYPNSSLKCNL